MAPDDFTFGVSASGYMIAQNFFEYIANFFDPRITEKNIKRPVVLFIDGHASQVTLHLSKFCSEHGIVLISLHPNATHLRQPCDVSLFHPLKVMWVKIYREFCLKSRCIGIQKYQFAPLLKDTLDAIDCAKIFKNGFRRCGLFPFDVEAIDFDKILELNKIEAHVSTSDPEPVYNTCAQNKSLEGFEIYLTKEQVEAFRLSTDPMWKGNASDKGLFDI